MNIGEFDNSEFVKRTDLEKPALITMRKVEMRMMADSRTGEERKKCAVHFKEPVNGKTAFVANQTNRNLIARIVGSRDTDKWIGRQIVLYDDPTVMMGGKEVGGIRVRAPKNKPHRSVDIEESSSDDDEIPY